MKRIGMPCSSATSDPRTHGTGDTRLAVIASRTSARCELHARAAIEFTCSGVDRSQARTRAGVTAQPLGPWHSPSTSSAGRVRHPGRIPNAGRLPAVRNIDGVPTLAQPLDELQDEDQFKGRPLFIDVERYDIFDLAVGARFSLSDHVMLAANFLVPLNQDGLRADFIPTVAVEVSF
jgi:hypothetical protein